MTPEQQQAFTNASGFHASTLHMLILVVLGGVMLASSVGVLVGLMHLLDSTSMNDKSSFWVTLFGLLLALSIVFLIMT